MEAKSHETRNVEIAPEQAQLLLRLQAQLDAAQAQLNTAFAAVLAGHGITAGRVTGLQGNTLTVAV